MIIFYLNRNTAVEILHRKKLGTFKKSKVGHAIRYIVSLLLLYTGPPDADQVLRSDVLADRPRPARGQAEAGGCSEVGDGHGRGCQGRPPFWGAGATKSNSLGCVSQLRMDCVK